MKKKPTMRTSHHRAESAPVKPYADPYAKKRDGKPGPRPVPKPAGVTLAEAEALRRANKAAVDRAAALEVEVESLRARCAELEARLAKSSPGES